MNQYMITFAVDLGSDVREHIEQECRIPARFDSETIEAESAREAMEKFCALHDIRRRVVPTGDLLRMVYAVRTGDNGGFQGYRIAGLKWNHNFTMLVPSFSPLHK